MTPPAGVVHRPNAVRTKYRGKVRPDRLEGPRRFLRESEWFWAVVFFAVVGSLFARQFHIPPPPSLPLDSIATRDIRAPFDLDIPDEGATEAKRKVAVDQVLPVYDFDSAKADEAVSRTAAFFAESRKRSGELQAWERTERPGKEARREAEERFFRRLSESAGGWMSRYGLKEFYHEGFSPSLEEAICAVIRETLSQKVVAPEEHYQGRDAVRVRDIRKRGAEWDMKSPATGEIPTSDQVRERVGRRVEATEAIPQAARGAAEEYIRGLVAPTLTFNSQETAHRQEVVANQVEPLVIAVRKGGQPIVTAGERVDAKVILKITAFQNASRRLVNLPLVTALLSFLLLLLLCAFMYLKSYGKEHATNLKLFVIFLQLATGFALLDQALLSIMGALTEGSPSPLLGPQAFHAFLLPVAAGATLVTILVDRNIAVVYTLFWSVLFGMLSGMSFPLAIYALLASCAGIFATAKYGRRKAPRKAALVQAVMQVALAGGVLAAGPQWEAPFQGTQVWALLAAVGGGILTPLAVLPLVQPFEQAYGLLTGLRLTVLANTNHPVLARLSVEAPGTYGHSMMVATLSEAAAYAIGADGLFCRVGSYYHDIGKLFNPGMFVENQMSGHNPHDRIPPISSAKIVAAHVKEGIAIAREHGLPQALIDLIPQHHGDRRVSYFYNKALTMAGSHKETVRDADFQYPGPKPASREAAILMLADGVEAGSRLLREPSDAKLEQLISEICDRAVSEDQLVQCDLTYEDMAKIRATFFTILKGAFAKRISYPNFEFDKEEPDGRKGSGGPLPPA